MHDLRRRFPLYARLLYLYPAAYRREYGEQILQTTADMLDHLPRRRDRFRLWLRLALDVPFNLGRQQLKYLGETMHKSEKPDPNLWFRPRRFGIGYQSQRWQGVAVLLPLTLAGLLVSILARRDHPEWFQRNPLRLDAHAGLSTMPRTWQGWLISITFVITLLLVTKSILSYQRRVK